MPGQDPALLLQRPARHPDVAWRSWGGEVVILTPAGHDAHAPAGQADGAEHDLNEVASHIWELCDGARTVEEIAADVEREFEVDAATARADALELVEDLVRHNLLVLHLGAQAGSSSHEVPAP